MPSCGSCGSEWRSGELASHLSGCAQNAMDVELERRRRQEEESRPAVAQPCTHRHVRVSYDMHGSATIRCASGCSAIIPLNQFIREPRQVIPNELPTSLQRAEDGGTRVSRNRYERVQRFPGPNGTVVENPQASVDGVTWINEPWEAMQAFRPSRESDRPMTATEVAIRQEASRQRAAANLDAEVYGVGVASIGALLGAMDLMTGDNMRRMAEQVDVAALQRAIQSEIMVPVDAPRTSADIPSDRPRGKHEVTRLSSFQADIEGIEIRCSCGWEVTRAWLAGVAERDVRGMIEAHCAGGQVGPQKQKARADVACYNCGGGYVKPVSPRVANMCCDGELIVKPRRHFKLELDS